MAFLAVAIGALAIWHQPRVRAQSGEKETRVATPELINGKIAFSSRQAGPTFPFGRIITANPDGTGRVTLSGPSDQDFKQPAWSPDGTKLVFASVQVTDDLFVQNVDGTGYTNISNTGNSIRERNPSWSANNKIAYERDSSQIWIINPDGTGNVQFPGITGFASTPAWSPDGSKLAFVTNGEIWVINADGSNLRQVTNNTTDDTDPAWSPDGNWILFSKGNDIAIINQDGTSEGIVLTSGTMPSWSPDGTKIAFRRSGIYVADANGGNQIRIIADQILFPLCCDTIFESPVWQPVVQPPNTYSIGGSVRYNNLPLAGATMNLSGTSTASATVDAAGNYQFSGLVAGGSYTVTPSYPNHIFNPASRSFANLTSNATGNFDVQGVDIGNGRIIKNGVVAFVYNGNILTVNADGTNERTVIGDPSSESDPHFSPSGSTIVFTSNRDGNSELYRANSDGSNVVRLTNNPAADSGGFHSPNGIHVVFSSSRDGNSEIYRMNSDGSNPVNLSNNSASDFYPSYSPDGTKVVFVSNRLGKSQIFSMNADGTNAQVLGETNTIAPCYQRPTYSPDGTKITFSFSPDCGTTHKSMWEMNADGTNRISLGLGNYATYSADGTKRLSICCYFEPNLDPARLRVAGIAGGTTQTLSQTVLNFVDSHPTWQSIPVIRRAQYDFDGDGKADVSVFRPSENKWYILQSSTMSVRESTFAIAGDVPVPGDYDGDGKTDVAIFRPSTGQWWFLSSINNAQIPYNWGQNGDIPRPSDFDGDGKTDYVVFRPSNGVWYRYGSTGVTSIIPFGAAGDLPLTGDFDGDGKSDPAIFRPSTGDWWWAASSFSNLHLAVHWGQAGDQPAAGDYDGDGKTDFVVFRPSDGGWYILYSTGSYTITTFGTVGDKAIAADYDGDGKADVAVFRPSTGTWFLSQTTAGFGALQWGIASDTAIPNAYVP